MVASGNSRSPDDSSRVQSPIISRGMSGHHCVVVWECCDPRGRWLPYTPAVAQHLERAHAKQLTRVMLSDADPTLVGCYVNLRTQTQCYDNNDGLSIESSVRRSLYPVTSPAGRGIRWEWRGGGGWEPLPLATQCALEAGDTLSDPALEGGTLRRVQQPPYPLTKARELQNGNVPGRRTTTIPHQHTGSSVKSNKSVISSSSAKSVHSHNSNNSIANRAPAKLPSKMDIKTLSSANSSNSNNSLSSNSAVHASGMNGNVTNQATSREKGKHNFARQILHNLNIFSHKSAHLPINGLSSGLLQDLPSTKRSGALLNHVNGTNIANSHMKTGSVGTLDADSSSTRSGRRPSVDTISTYLSHESKDSLNQQSVTDLLDCSMGSDDVFEADPLPGQIHRPKTPSSSGSIVGVDAASSVISGFVRVVETVQWGAVCPPCLAPLAPPCPPQHPPPPPSPSHKPKLVVALSLCSHMMHLACLNRILTRQQRTNKGALYIQCPVCSKVYGEMRGNQPPGTMGWGLQAHTLPGQNQGTHTIQITYNVVSGVQGPEHPSPGRPYYAVGFPRHCYLPDTQQGRRVLNLLSVAWERRLVFTIGRSVTTGREDIVTWSGIEHRTERGQFTNANETALFLERVIRQLNMRGVSDGQDEQGLYQELS